MFYYKSFDQLLDAAKINHSIVFLPDSVCHTVFHHKKKENILLSEVSFNLIKKNKLDHQIYYKYKFFYFKFIKKKKTHMDDQVLIDMELLEDVLNNTNINDYSRNNTKDNIDTNIEENARIGLDLNHIDINNFLEVKEIVDFINDPRLGSINYGYNY
jgi:hypothetical protein